MAEVLGVVSSGLSVVSVAVQLAESIRKLKDFYDLVKDAPAEVRLSLNEVEALSFVLQDIEISVQDQSKCSQAVRAAVTRSVNLCRVSSEALHSLARDLHNGIEGGRKWSSVKAALKSDKIAKFQGRLESAKTTLLLANQCYYHAIQRQDWEFQRRSMSELQFTVSTLAKTTQIYVEQKRTAVGADFDEESDSVEKIERRDNHLVSRPATWSETRRRGNGGWPFALLGSFEYQKVQRWNRPRGQPAGFVEETSITIQLPTWLTGKRYQLRSKRAYSGWDHKLRTFNTVSQLSPVLRMCRRGDVEGIKELFKNGQASPFDVDIGGGTLLHHAASSGRLDVIRSLLDQGADANVRASYFGFPGYSWGKGGTPLEVFTNMGGLLSFPNGDRLKFSEQDFLDILRLLVNKGGADPLESKADGRNALNLYFGPAAGLSWLLTDVSFHNIPNDGLEEPLWVSKFECGWYNLVDLIREGLPNRKVSREVTRQTDKQGRTFLHLALDCWTRESIRQGRYTSQMATDLRHLLKETVHANADLHALTSQGTSPLQVLWKYGRTVIDTVRTRRGCRKALSAWFHILHDCNIDCRAYAEREVLRIASACSNDDCVSLSMGAGPHKWIDIKWKSPTYIPSQHIDQTLYCLSEFWDGLGVWEHRGQCVSLQPHNHPHFLCKCLVTDDEDEPDTEDGDEMPSIPGAWISETS